MQFRYFLIEYPVCDKTIICLIESLHCVFRVSLEMVKFLL